MLLLKEEDDSEQPIFRHIPLLLTVIYYSIAQQDRIRRWTVLLELLRDQNLYEAAWGGPSRGN